MSDNQRRKREIIIIMLSSILIHIFMPFVLGNWWDDYKYQVFKYADIKEHMVSAGRLDAYYMLMPVNKLPIWAFRILVVISYLISAVLIYLIIAETFENLEMAFGIGVLYNAIPVNDVRLMKCVYPYTLAVCMFLIATYLLIREFKRRNNVFKYITLIGCCILFLISFSMSSLLFYYIMPIALLWYCIARETICNGEKRNYSLFVQEVIQYWYLYIIPFAFFAIKKLFFKPDPQGLYDKEGKRLQYVMSKRNQLVHSLVPFEKEEIKKSIEEVEECFRMLSDKEKVQYEVEGTNGGSMPEM